MTWSASEIKNLRYRMGWSQAEMARLLGCGPQMVLSWESGQALPETKHRTLLVGFFNQLENFSEKTQRRPMAEVLMKANNLAQIHDTEVLECLADGQLAKFTFQV